MLKQPSEAVDLNRDFQAAEDGPEQDLVRLEDESTVPVLQLLDGACCPKAVAAEDHGFGTVTHMLRDPLHDHGRLDLVWAVGKVSQERIDHVESLALEVLGTELVLLVSEPWRANEADALDAVRPQREEGGI